MNSVQNELSIVEKLGQLFFPAAFINDSDENIRALETLIRNYAIGGLTFFHSREMAATNYEKQTNILRNKNSYQRLNELIEHYQSISKYPLLMSIDAEWGLAMRVENTEQYPYALTLGALPDPYLAFEVGEAIGKDLFEAGIHLNLAPVFDINENPANPVIGYRSFGEDKQKVANFATAFYRGMNSVGILGCAKHFPGHGNTSVDSHLSLPVIDKSEKDLMDMELYPFTKAIEMGIDLVMPGHLAIPALSGSTDMPASLSKQIVTDLLRHKLKFQGAVITDALNMHAVANRFEVPGQLELEAFNAGNDILSFSSSIPEAIELILHETPDERIEQSYDRLLVLKDKMGIWQDNNRKTQPLTKKEATGLREKIALQCITQVKEGNSLTTTGLDKTACLILNITSDASVFAKKVSAIRKMPIYELSYFSQEALRTIEESLKQYEKIIVGLYVPNIKPLNNFGLSTQLIDWLSSFTKTKAVHLVVFGNPYALSTIPYKNTERTLLAYQNMPEFEEKAAEMIFAKAEAIGQLPVTIA